MKVMYRFYDSSNSTISPQEFYLSDVPIVQYDFTSSFMKVMYRFYDSAILPEDCYESDVPIVRFF